MPGQRVQPVIPFGVGGGGGSCAAALKVLDDTTKIQFDCWGGSGGSGLAAAEAALAEHVKAYHLPRRPGREKADAAR